MTKEYFKLRLEAKLKNARLREAREELEMSLRQVASVVGISEASYGNIERMQTYPSMEIRKKICEFYTLSGIEMQVEDVFPEKLKEFRPKRIYTATKEVPTLQLESIVEHKYLLAESIDKEIEKDDLKLQLKYTLRTLTEREAKIISLYYGLEEGREPESLENIASLFGLGRERIRQIKEKAIRRLRHASRSKQLRVYLGGE